MSKELYGELEKRGLFEYGSVIKADMVREILGIEMPEYGTKADFDAIALAELGAIDYVRRMLLNHGKYLAGNQGDYRILLPSENRRQVEIYMSQADKKLKRGLQLSKNSPKTDYQTADQSAARIMLKRESIRDFNRQAA